MEKIGAVITAVGQGARKKQQNPLKKVDGVTIASRIVVTLQKAGVKDIVVVAGEKEDDLKKELRGYGVTFLKNPSGEKGEMLDAIQIGLEYLKERCDSVLVCPVEVSFFTEQTVRMLLDSSADITIPSYHRRAGHPVRINSRRISDIMNYKDADGLRGAFRTAGITPEYVNVEDEGILARANQPEEMKALPKQNTQTAVRVQVKVRLVKETPFFGPGIVTLLKQIAVLNSVREASAKTGISYSKAWTMIREAERQTGQQLVERQPGGKFGGTASVTAYGSELVKKYEELERRIEQFAEEQFENILTNNLYKE